MTSVPAIQHLEQALALATQSLNITSPNPRVGCVITNSAGLLLGQGLTQRAGGPHAEIMALQDASAKGHSVKGATAYVTLDPRSREARHIARHNSRRATSLLCDIARQIYLSKSKPMPRATPAEELKLIESIDARHPNGLGISAIEAEMERSPWKPLSGSSCLLQSRFSI